ncbi:MAG: DUF4255 domain-containing protein [Rhizobiales bacterium]|nr:DUF4255 domain-containing protein [Hyphomicrobiales bacterium]
MSNSEAIAAVTERLRNKLTAGGTLGVTVDPLDKLASSPGGNPGLNLHLYRILPNANWRNMDMPWRVNPGETARAPLALDLHYLLTATAPGAAAAQRHLGAGMLVLHDNPVLDPGGGAVVPFERARITMQPLSLDDMEKLWAGVASPRLLSVAYEVSVVLIESAQPVRSPLPVLARGTGSPDSIEVQAGLYPAIERIEIGEKPFDNWLRSGTRPGRSAAHIDDTIFLYGHGLTGNEKKTAIITSLVHPDPDKVLEVTTFTGNSRGGLGLNLSNVMSNGKKEKVPAGPCSIMLKIARDRKAGSPDERFDVTNAMSFSLAPVITSVDPEEFTVPKDITVKFDPPLIAGQTVALIVAGQRVLPASVPANSSAIFRLENLAPDIYPVRLRVDGVDSVPIDLTQLVSGAVRPAFINLIKVKP